MVPPSAVKASLFKTVKPFIAPAAVIITGSVLVAAIFFTLLDLAWIAFLAGVLFASILAMTTQATRAEMTSASRAEQLTLAEHHLAKETGHREKLEEQLAAANARLHYSDQSQPAMLAFVDHSTRYLYHNRAFANWLGLADDKIDGQHMRDVLGRKVFAEVEPYVFKAAQGHIVRYERTHKTPGGALCRVAVQYLPQFDKDEKYAGFYIVITDITERRDVALPADEPDRLARVSPAKISNTGSHTPGRPVPPVPGDAAMSDEPVNESVNTLANAWTDASERILAAINGNEFSLFCQRIMPLAGDGSGPGHYEVLIRLHEEESSLIPPGAFFPLAEEYGLLPQLDRWVFSHVLDWMVTPAGAATVRAGAIYFVKIATATISDPDFPEFVEYQLRRTGVPGRSVCVEIAEPDLIMHQGDAVAFANAIIQCGCRIAVSGFGRNRLSVETLKLFPVDFLKIDNSIVRQIIAYPTYLAKAVAISKLSKAIGVSTIAEMVEDDATLAMLRKLKVDFAQGFGISLPHRLTDLKGPAVKPEPKPAEQVLIA